MLRIKDIALQKDIRQKDVAVQLNITKASVSNIFNNKTSPSLSTLLDIAKVLDVHVIELFRTGEEYSHFYDDESGVWLGIRRK